MDRHRPPDIIVIAGGSPAVAHALARSVRSDGDAARPVPVVAADSGVAIALDWGLSVAIAVGDFDSLDPALVERLDQIAGEVLRFDASKDDTDLALALTVAVERAGPGARVLVAAVEGGRLDHTLANFALLAGPTTGRVEVEIALDDGRAHVVRDTLDGRWDDGDVISLIPMHGDAVVSITGVRWPLTEVRLGAGTSLGVSNVVVGGGHVSLTVHDGVVLAIAPCSPRHESPTSETNP